MSNFAKCLGIILKKKNRRNPLTSIAPVAPEGAEPIADAWGHIACVRINILKTSHTETRINAVGQIRGKLRSIMGLYVGSMSYSL